MNFHTFNVCIVVDVLQFGKIWLWRFGNLDESGCGRLAVWTNLIHCYFIVTRAFEWRWVISSVSLTKILLAVRFSDIHNFKMLSVLKALFFMNFLVFCQSCFTPETGIAVVALE